MNNEIINVCESTYLEVSSRLNVGGMVVEFAQEGVQFLVSLGTHQPVLSWPLALLALILLECMSYVVL
jgi:hypothetical protein